MSGVQEMPLFGLVAITEEVYGVLVNVAKDTCPNHQNRNSTICHKAQFYRHVQLQSWQCLLVLQRVWAARILLVHRFHRYKSYLTRLFLTHLSLSLLTLLDRLSSCGSHISNMFLGFLCCCSSILHPCGMVWLSLEIIFLIVWTQFLVWKYLVVNFSGHLIWRLWLGLMF